MIGAKSFAKNVSYSLIANIVNLVVSSVTAILIPVFLKEHIEDYGYYQIYLFYISYIGFFHFGLCDGFLLRNAGKTSDELDRESTSFQFWILSSLEWIISFLLCFILLVLKSERNFMYIGIAFGLNLLIFIPRNYVSNLLQAVNLHKNNSLITIIGRVAFLLIVIFLLFNGVTNFVYYIAADLLGKVLALLYGLLTCRKLIFRKVEFNKNNWKELTLNLKSGIKITLAGISSLVITGVVKFSIQSIWDVETYGIISFVLTLSNLVLSFVTAVSIVLFPSLKLVEEDTQKKLYNVIKNTLLPALMLTVFFAFPGYIVLSKLLPEYLDGLKYIPYLFPICYFSSKSSLLVQTYMQIKRLENNILIANIVSIVFSAALTLIFVLWLKKLDFAIPIILVGQIVKSIVSEIMLNNYMNLSILKDILIETIAIFLYIFVFIIFGNLVSFASFFIIYFLYIFLKRKEVIFSYKYVFSMLKK